MKGDTWVYQRATIHGPYRCWPALFSSNVPSSTHTQQYENMVFLASCVVSNDDKTLSSLPCMWPLVKKFVVFFFFFPLFKMSGDCQAVSPMGPLYPGDNKWCAYYPWQYRPDAAQTHTNKLLLLVWCNLLFATCATFYKWMFPKGPFSGCAVISHDPYHVNSEIWTRRCFWDLRHTFCLSLMYILCHLATV